MSVRTAQDLRAAFPDPFGKSAEKLFNWAQQNLATELDLESLLTQHFEREQHRPMPNFSKGVNIYGYFLGVFGVAQSARLLHGALKEVKVQRAVQRAMQSLYKIIIDYTTSHIPLGNHFVYFCLYTPQRILRILFF